MIRDGFMVDTSTDSTIQEASQGINGQDLRGGSGTKWERQIVEDGGVAVEDLSVADLNGDGRPDLVAVGRQTHNIRIYWNEGAR